MEIERHQKTEQFRKRKNKVQPLNTEMVRKVDTIQQKLSQKKRLTVERVMAENVSHPILPRYRPEGDDITRLDSGGFNPDSIVVVYPRTHTNRPFAALLTGIKIGTTNTGEPSINYMARAKVDGKVRSMSLGGGTTVKRI
jgi:hypothetical protein